MSIFRKRSRTKRGAEPVLEPAVNKHISKHAAAGTVAFGSNTDPEAARQRITVESQKRMANPKPNALPNNIAYQAMNSPRSSPYNSSVFREGGGSIAKDRKSNACRTSPATADSLQNGSSRTNPGSVSALKYQAPSFDNPTLGNPKMQVAARDRGNPQPHHSADSGYSSTGPSTEAHSRTPSERSTSSKQQEPRESSKDNSDNDDSSSLPYLVLVEELAREPAFSETWSKDCTFEPTGHGSGPNIVLRHSTNEISSSAHRLLDTWTTQSPHTPRPINKQTRFQQAKHVVPRLPLEQPTLHATATSPLRQQQGTQSHSTTADRDIPALKERSAHLDSTPQPQSRGLLSHERVAFPNSRQISAGILPALSILDGIKVNKKGKLLDEEGDAIGELYEGDIIDCVRQKANAYGEVLDQYGGVVGRVKTIAKTQGSPVSQSASPIGSMQQYFGGAGQYQPSNLQDCSSPASGDDECKMLQSEPRCSSQRRTEQQVDRLAAGCHVGAKSRPSFPNTCTSENSEGMPACDYQTVYIPTPSLPNKSSMRPASAERQTHAQILDQTGDAGRRTSSQTSPIESRLRPNQDKDETDHTRVSGASASNGTPSQQTNELLILGAQGSNMQQQQQQQQQRVMRVTSAPPPRNSSDNSAFDLRRSYARSSMSAVPVGYIFPDEDRNPALFSYKGEIPAADGPPPGSRVAAPGAAGPEVANSAPGSSRLLPSGTSNPEEPSSYNSPKPPRAQCTTGIGTGLKPGFSARHSSHQPLMRSPLSSHETSPPESGKSTSDDSQVTPSPRTDRASFRLGASGAHSRQASARAVGSAQPSAPGPPTQPRTYFTHRGQVTMATGAPAHSAPAAAEAPAMNPAAQSGPSASSEKHPTKKQARFSFGRGKKDPSPVVAH